MIDYAQTLINFKIATSKILPTKAGYLDQKTVAEILRDHGFASEADYWEAAFSEPMPDESFRHLLMVHLAPTVFIQTPTDPRSWQEEVDRINSFLYSTFKKALDVGEPLFIKTPCNELFVRPREAVNWLLANRLRAALVSPGLKKFVTGIGEPQPKLEKAIEVLLSDVRSFLARKQQEIGHVPPINKTEGELKREFPNQTLNRESYRAIHQQMFGSQPPGPRAKSNCAK